MNDRALRFTQIQVHRVRGIPRDQSYALPDLSPGVNLVYGPNASGKSTTACVLQELVWPGRTGLDRPSVTGCFGYLGHRWNVEIDAGHVRTLRDGEAGNAPHFGPPENRHRYHLALHELVQQETRNTDFAKRIAEASQGGYNLDAAAADLGYRDKPPGRRKERESLEINRAALNKARQHQAAVRQEAQELHKLRDRHAAALKAERTLEWLEKAREYHGAIRDYREIQVELEVIPSGVTRLRGDEREQLDGFAKQRAHLEQDQRAEQERLARAEAKQQKASLPKDGIGPETWSQLRGWGRSLTDCETDLRQQQRLYDEAEETAKQARQRLGDNITDEQLAAVDRLELPDLDDFASKVDQLQALRALLREKQKWLQSDAPEAVRNVNGPRLQEGIPALGRWLAAPPPPQPPSGTRLLLVLAVTISVVLSLALAFLHHFVWSLIAFPALFLLWFDWHRHPSSGEKKGADERGVHRRTFDQTGLTPPASWEVTAVTECLNGLLHQAGVRALEDERRRRRADLVEAEQDLATRERTFTEEKSALQGRLGLKIDIEDAWFSHLLKKIDEWQDANNRAKGLGHALRELRARHADGLERINAALAPFGYGPSENGEAAQSKIEDLAARWQAHQEAVATIESARRRLHDIIQPGLEQSDARRTAIFERLELDPAQERTIDDWLKLRETYDNVARRLSRAAALRDDRKTALAEHADLLQLEPAELQQRIETERTMAQQRDELHAQIVRIERDIEQAKAGHDLTDALAAYASSVADLEVARDQCGAAVVGATLTNWVRQVAVDQTRPEVFGRANEILADFTRYTLNLELDDQASPPAFRARRVTGETSRVDELSAGERLQLLLAVRVAFIEQDEAAQLPLLLDETLGTSDDDRAGRIIDSAIALARQGRQIFYFTAQHDEVAKWRFRLEQTQTESSPVPYKLIDLAEIRRDSVARTTPLPTIPKERPTVPAPDGRDYLGYGRLLRVPGLNSRAGNLAHVHLWHLLEDPRQLYDLLSQGITTWGQLRLLRDQGGAALIEPHVLQRASAAAKAIETACEAWRIGRGQPVDRRALLESGAVSETFIDALSNLAERLNGNAGKLIEALQAKEIPRWRQDNTEALHSYFLENGYLTDESPFTTAEIRIRVLAATSQEYRLGLLDLSLIDRIIDSLSQAPVPRSP